tara:strand:- start:19 stop:843 length:825 start_codon:yes stop_codon:yes gene_type:complete
MEKYSFDDYQKLKKDNDFLKEYEKYKTNKPIQEFSNFLNNIQLNVKYFRLTTNNKIGKNKHYRNKNISKDTLSIKEINSYLNKLTENNKKKIIQNIQTRIDNKSYLNDIIIKNILNKCILQPSYIKCYLDVLLEIYGNINNFTTIIETNIQQIYETITKNKEEISQSEYLDFCDKNKKLDLLIGYSILITELEKQNIIKNKIHKFLDYFLNIMENQDDTDEKYKSVQCLYNIFKSYYEEDTELPQGFIDKLTYLKNNEKSMKIKFKLMDILERK